MKSLMSSMGSPKNLSPPCSSICSSPRWMAPMLAALMLPVLGGELARVFAHVLQRGAQVLHVQDQQAVVVGDLEHQVQHAGLRLVQRQHACQQQRAHVGDGGAHRVAGCSPNTSHSVAGQVTGSGGRPQAAFLQDGGQLGADAAGLGDAGEVALHVGHEDRHAELAEVLGQGLQRDGLAGAGWAPVIRPWRLARAGSSSQKTSPRWATRMGSGMRAPALSDRRQSSRRCDARPAPSRYRSC